MKQAAIFAVCITAFHFSFAKPSYNKIDFSVETYKDYSAVKIIPSVNVMMQEIINVTGLQLNFELKEADLLNHSLTKDKWAATALLAHEIGHHLKFSCSTQMTIL